MSRAACFLIVGIVSTSACTPWDPYAYEVDEQLGPVDSCEKTVWVGSPDSVYFSRDERHPRVAEVYAKTYGDNRLVNFVRESLEEAGWTVVTTNTNDGEQDWSDGIESGERYLIFPHVWTIYNVFSACPRHVDLQIRMLDSHSGNVVLSVRKVTYMSKSFAEFFVNALESMTICSTTAAAL